MKQVTDKIRQQHRNRQAELAVALYQHKRAIENIEQELRDIEVIMGATQAVDEGYDKLSEVKDEEDT